MCSNSIFYCVERCTLNTSASHTKSTVIILVESYSCAISKLKPAGFNYSLAYGHISANAIYITECKVYFCNFFWEIGVVSPNEIAYRLSINF